MGSNPIIETEITNDGSLGSAKCELGLYTEDTVKNWFNGRLPGLDFTFNIGAWDKWTANL